MENQNNPTPVPLPWEPGRNKKLGSLAQQMSGLVDQAKRQNYQLNTNDAIDRFRGRDDFYRLARDFYFLKYGQEPPTHTQQWMENERGLPLSADWREQQKKKPKG